MRNRAFRRAKTFSKMWKRLKEDRNQHYNDLACPCWTDKKAMARFKEQPKNCSHDMCGNARRMYGAYVRTIQEKRHFQEGE